MKLILGSASPRRKEILGYFSLPFTQVSSDFNEESINFEDNPEIYVKTIAKGKAEAIAKRFPSHLIMTADTIVYKGGKVYLKPNDREHAYSMLKELQGGWHSVFTAICLIKDNRELLEIEETRVLFNPLSESQIETYLRMQPYHDKAGSYFIQGSGSLLVRRINGCFYNVMGLPINQLYKMLKEFGIDLWDYLHG